jgi:hypothetical protein
MGGPTGGASSGNGQAEGAIDPGSRINITGIRKCGSGPGKAEPGVGGRSPRRQAYPTAPVLPLLAPTTPPCIPTGKGYTRMAHPLLARLRGHVIGLDDGLPHPCDVVRDKASHGSKARPMHLISDTNVWYDIAAGRRDPAALKRGENQLVAIPVSFLEIASKIETRTWEERRGAAGAVVKYADQIAADPESHLASLWGLPVGAEFPWIEGFKAIAQATSVADLANGVDDLEERVRRKLNVPLAQGWREYHWKDFAEGVTDAIDEHCPGYKAARANGKYKYLRKERAKSFADAMRSKDVSDLLLGATFLRAQITSGDTKRPTRWEMDRVGPLLAPYINAYTEYVIGCATGQFAPQPNDLGDCECFLYLQGDSRLLSQDKKWMAICRKACAASCFESS